MSGCRSTERSTRCSKTQRHPHWNNSRRDPHGALLVLPCGYGKTVCALYLAHQLGRRIAGASAQGVSGVTVARTRKSLLARHHGRQDTAEHRGVGGGHCRRNGTLHCQAGLPTGSAGFVWYNYNRRGTSHVGTLFFSRALRKTDSTPNTYWGCRPRRNAKMDSPGCYTTAWVRYRIA